MTQGKKKEGLLEKAAHRTIEFSSLPNLMLLS